MLKSPHDDIAGKTIEGLLTLLHGDAASPGISGPSELSTMRTLLRDVAQLVNVSDSKAVAQRVASLLNDRSMEGDCLGLRLAISMTLAHMGRYDDSASILLPMDACLDKLHARQSIAWCQLQYILGNYGSALLQLDLHQHETVETVHALKIRLLIGLGRLAEAGTFIKSSPFLLSAPAATFQLLSMLIDTLDGQPPSSDQLSHVISRRTLTSGNHTILLLLLAEMQMTDQAIKLMNQMSDTPFLRVNRAHVLHLAGCLAEADDARQSVLKDAMAWNPEAEKQIAQHDLLARYVASGYPTRVPPGHPWVRLSVSRWLQPSHEQVVHCAWCAATSS